MSRGMTLTTWIKAVALSCVGFLAPTKPLIVGMLVAVLVDTATGIVAAVKRGERITSAGLRRTITKIAVYCTAVLAFFVLQKLLLGDLIPAERLVAGAIGIFEMKSILENLTTILGMPVFQAVMAKLGSVNDPKKAAGDPTSSKPAQD